jgi:uncharacterized Zn finger protein
MFGSYDFPPYVSVAERRRRAQAHASKLKKKGRVMSPVVIQGRAIATTFWGKSWCDNLEAYSDFASRLPRGRTYARNGSVFDLQIAPGKVSALVSGSEIYEVEVSMRALPARRWAKLVAECAGGIDSVVELLGGRFSDAVMAVLCRKGKGLFPAPEEIELDCSCPDGAYLCKHLAAVLYGVGARLDHAPELLFALRQVDHRALVGAAARGAAKSVKPAKNQLAPEGLSDIFGIELEVSERKPPRPRARR